MHTTVVQRWRNRRESYRPSGEVINPRNFEVAPVPTRDAREFVARHHYLRTFPAARYCFGLYSRAALAGVAVFSHPCHDGVLTNVFGGSAVESAELGRFVLLDEVPANGESWFLSRCLKHLRRAGLRGVVSFCDPVPRTTVEGAVVHKGHVGTIYAALSGVYLGRATPRLVRVLPDGSVLSERSIQKIRSQERGWRYAAKILEDCGAQPLRDQSAPDWVAYWLTRLTRRLHHGGNHKYAWPLDRAVRKQMPESRPYPKFADGAAERFSLF